MAKTKKKSKRFQFELGIPGLIFVTGLLVCLFLWMFILGFWLGQKMVTSKAQKAGSPVAQKTLQEKRVSPPLVTEEVKPPAVEPEKETFAPKPLLSETKTTRQTPPPAPQPRPGEKASSPGPVQVQTTQAKGPEVPRKKAKSIKVSLKEIKVKKESPPIKFYTLQVASFRSPKEAQKYARFLSSRGYEALVRKVNLPKKGLWYRVYVGRFKTLAEAKTFGQELARKEKIKNFYITRIEERR